MIYIYLYMLATGGVIAMACVFKRTRWLWASLAAVMIVAAAVVVVSAVWQLVIDPDF
jgi:hypothetical protein